MNRTVSVAVFLILPFIVGCATSPLNQALKRKDLAEVQRLVESGADLNKIDGMRRAFAPLPQAVIYGTPEIVDYLLKKGAGQHDAAVERAAYLNRSEMLDVLLDNGVSMNPGEGEAIDSALRRHAARTKQSHGNLDDDAYNRMRAAAALPP